MCICFAIALVYIETHLPVTARLFRLCNLSLLRIDFPFGQRTNHCYFWSIWFLDFRNHQFTFSSYNREYHLWIQVCTHNCHSLLSVYRKADIDIIFFPFRDIYIYIYICIYVYYTHIYSYIYLLYSLLPLDAIWREKYLANHGLDNSCLPDGTNPIPEPIRTL